ncbi:MAG: hypothetical protein Q9222_002135 [Ikaeria aurantiellina]
MVSQSCIRQHEIPDSMLPSSKEFSEQIQGKQWHQKKSLTDSAAPSHQLAIRASEHDQYASVPQTNVAQQRSSSKHPYTPQGFFENLPTYFSETYTMEQRIPASYRAVISTFEKCASDNFRINAYKVFLHVSPRQWRSFDISITVCRSSKYWAVTKLSPIRNDHRGAISYAGAAAMPQSLVLQLQRYFSGRADVCDESQFQFSVEDRNELVPLRHETIQPPAAINYHTSAHQHLDTLMSLDDLGCPRYYETDVVQIAPVACPNRFASCLGGELVYETKFGRSPPTYCYLYTIRVLRAMDNEPGFARCQGVVTNTSGRRLKSFLITIPRMTGVLQPIELVEGRFITWTRREKWARQAIAAVHRVHSKGYVVGTLTSTRSPFVINSQDDLHLYCFRRNFFLGASTPGYYPPESRQFQYLSRATDEADCPRMTPKTDIFHLGLILWRLAEVFMMERNSPVCHRQKCLATNSRLCDDSHRNPVALPPLSSDVPK